LNDAWTEFKKVAPDIFGASRLIDTASIEGNEELLAATKAGSAPKIILGQDYSPAATLLFPEKLNYANIRNGKLAVKMAGIVKADVLIAVNYKAEYFMKSGLQIGGMGGGAAKMRIYALITAVDSKGKLLSNAVIQAESDEEAALVMNNFDSANYPKLIVSAQKNLIPKLTKEIAGW
jgi:hypothetical protein